MALFIGRSSRLLVVEDCPTPHLSFDFLRQWFQQAAHSLTPPFESLLVQAIVNVVSAFLIDHQPGIPHNA
jgi:hypothetical protein